MKKILIVLSILFLIACNNSGNTTADVNNDTTATTETKQEEPAPSALGAAGCMKMISFQPGTEIEATTFDKNGKEKSKQYTKVLSVKVENGFTVAEVEGKDRSLGTDKIKVVNYNYKCDGDKIYFDIASMFRTEEKQQDGTFESSLIEYPINIKEGDVLPDAIGSMSSEKNGKKMIMKFIYKERKVEGKEEVATTAGTWNCFKITNTVESEMDIPGMDEKTKEMMKKMKENMKTTTTTWFAPDFGIVKMEMYMNGELQSRNEITAVKK
jgi:hypothetical protein